MGPKQSPKPHLQIPPHCPTNQLKRPEKHVGHLVIATTPHFRDQFYTPVIFPSLELMPDTNNLGEGRFILAHGFGHFRPVRVRKDLSVMLMIVAMVGFHTLQITRKQRGPEAGTTLTTSTHFR